MPPPRNSLLGRVRGEVGNDILDPADRCHAIVQLHAEGWPVTCIAGYLQTSRQTVHTTLRRWIEEGVKGLDDKSSAPKWPARKVTLDIMNTGRKLQENPELGEFRIHAKLLQLGIKLSPRTCGRILRVNRSFYKIEKPAKEPRELKPMPFQATERHEHWSVDIRYLDMHRLGGGMIYCIAILDNFSRAILASVISRAKDLTAYLMVLYAAIRQHGSPRALVSDSDAVFKAKEAMRIYRALGIKAAIWLYKETLTLEFADQPLAQYAGDYETDRRHFRAVTDQRLFETQYHSPQQPLWELGDGEWLKVLRVPPVDRRAHRPPSARQGQLFA